MENRAKSPSTYLTFAKTVGASPRSSNAFQNITNTFQRSVISTSKSKNDNRNGSTDKSKIKALPNYERYSMGNNLPFVTIFQTIEIERLSDEIETQRSKLKEYERLVFNAENFEVQIKELSQRCTSYESELGEYREELDKMNKICETLYHENQNLRDRLKNNDSILKSQLADEAKKNKQLTEELDIWIKKTEMSEKMKQNQIQEMKSMMENQRKSMIDREMKDMQVRHQGETAKLAVQIRRLNEMLAQKQRSLNDMMKKHQNSQDYIKQLREYGSRVNEYEQKICLLSQQHLKLSRINDLNITELDMARKKQFKLAQQLASDRQLILDNQHLRELVQLKDKQIQSWKLKIAELEQQAIRNSQLSHVNEQLNAKVSCMTTQNQKIAKLLKDRSHEIERWKKNVMELEDESRKCREIQDKLIEQESKWKVLQVQNQRLESINRVRTREFQDLKNRYAISQGELSNFNRLEKEKKNMEDKYKTQVERIMELELYIEKSQQQLKTLRQLQMRYQSSQPQFQSLKKQNERLASKILQYSSQLSILSQLEPQLQSLSSSLKQSQTTTMQQDKKIQIMNEQIQRLSEMLKNKNEQIVRLEDQKIHSLGVRNQWKGLQQETEDKDRTIGKLKADVSALENKIKGYQNKMEQIDNTNKGIFQNLHEQMQNMEQELKKKTRQHEDYKSKQSVAQNELQEMDQLRKFNQKQQNRISVYLKDLQDLRAQNKQYETTLSSQHTKISQLQSQLRRLKSATTEQELAMGASNRSVQSRKSTHSQRSAIAALNSNGDDSSSIQPQKLLLKIQQLEITLNDLKIKYEDLLKASLQADVKITNQKRSSMQSQQSQHVQQVIRSNSKTGTVMSIKSQNSMEGL